MMSIIIYFCSDQSAGWFDVEMDASIAIEKIINEGGLLRFVQQGATNLSHCNKLLVDLDAVQDGEDEIMQAIFAVRMLYGNIEIGMIATRIGGNNPLRDEMRANDVTLFEGGIDEVVRGAYQWIHGMKPMQEMNLQPQALVVWDAYVNPGMFNITPTPAFAGSPPPQVQTITMQKPRPQSKREVKRAYAHREQTAPSGGNRRTGMLAYIACSITLTLLSFIGLMAILVEPLRTAFIQFFFGGW